MTIYKDKKNKVIEANLSRFGASVSLAADDLKLAREAVMAAENRLEQMQTELEQLYMILDEPMLVTQKTSKTRKGTEHGKGKPAKP